MALDVKSGSSADHKDGNRGTESSGNIIRNTDGTFKLAFAKKLGDGTTRRKFTAESSGVVVPSSRLSNKRSYMQ